MKTLLTALALTVSCAGNLHAQPQPVPLGSEPSSAPASASQLSDFFYVGERGLNHRIWRHVTLVTNSTGVVMARTNSYAELATGMAHWSGDQLVDSDPEIAVTATGAIATNAQHTVRFLGNINGSGSGGAVTLTGSDGQQLDTQILGLSYYDNVAGKSVWIGEIQDSAGELLPSQHEVLYPNSFSGGDVVADVLYVNSIGGLEQLVLIRTQLPSPADWGLDPASTVLQVITEFSGATPAPQITQSAVNGDIDDFLDFGSIQMGPGFAFGLGDETNKIRVTKRWLVLSGRTCLVEQVPFLEAAPLLQYLPPDPAATGSARPSADSLINRVASNLVLPERKLAKNESQSLKLASKPLDSCGFAMDYTSLTSSTNWVFAADSTTFISGLVNLYGSNVWEGGCVLKFATNASISINPAFGTTPTTSFRGSIYRPIVMTAKDDNSCGQAISGSTGSPSGYYASPALGIASLATQTMVGMRFCYAKQAVSIGGNSANIYHSQFLNCQSGLSLGGGTVHLRNVLFGNVVTNIIIAGGVTISVENGSFSGSSYLATASSSSGSSLALTNCIFANVTNLSAGSFALSGDYNGFYQTTSFGTDVVPNNLGPPFQSVGAGNYYLVTGSSFRNAGTTSIDATLLSDLTNRTTFPPIVVSAMQISTNMILSPQIQRDTSPAAKDLGWHYDAVDWAIGSIWMFSANSITATPGVVIAGFGSSYSLGIAEGAQVNCQGAPNAPVRIVVYNTVQEQSVSPWTEVTSGYGLITDYFGLPASGALNFRFTDFSCLAQDESFVYAGTVIGNLQDCQVHGGQLWGDPVILNLTNCLLERVYTIILTSDNNLPTVRNNTFFGGTFGYSPNNTNGVVRDNLFDHTSFFFNPVYANLNFNAYVTNCSRLQPYAATDIILPSSPAYQVGPLGNFYLVSGASLINADTNLTADKVGLYHYTVTTNLVNGLQIKETNSLLDIGYHAVAVGSNGIPIDTGTGGSADYLLNAGGDGTTTNLYNWKTNTDDYRFELVPGHLRCEYRENPWGITTNYGPPRFFWIVTSPHRADFQTAYQILVATSTNNLNANYGDMWDSGRVYSSQTIQVAYNGTPLSSNARLWWKVRSWDLYTGISSWSTNAFFQVGLLSTNDWAASWLTTATDPGASSCPMYRHAFQQLTNTITRATVYVTAKGAYELWLDGQRIGSNILAPEWTDYNVCMQYQTFDVTTNLTSANTDGTNHVIGGIVAEGWYSGRISHDDPSWNIPPTYYTGYTNLVSGHGPKQLLIQLQIERSDGSVTNIVTDGTWKCDTAGPIQGSSIYDGETNDATRAASVANWSTYAYAGEATYFTAAVATESLVASQMFPQPNEPIQIVECVHPIDMWTNTAGGPNKNQWVRIFDMGQNMVGWCTVSLINTNYASGSTNITLRHAEMLNLDANNMQVRGATININSLGTTVGAAAQQTDVYYLLLTNLPQQFQPHFTYHGFRFVEIAGPPDVVLTTNSLVGCVLRSSVPIVGAFSCSHRDVNQAMTNAFWTRKANVFGVETDCPQRNERLGWLGDSDAWSQGACLMVDMAAFYTKIIRDMRDDQIRWEPAGSANFGYYQANNPFAGKAGGSVVWSSGGVIRPWRLYENYADTRMLSEHYLSASNFLYFFTHSWPGYFFNAGWGNGDALNGDRIGILTSPAWATPYAATPEGVIANCHYAYAADILANMSQVLKLQAQASGLTTLASTYANNYGTYTNIAANVRNQFTNAANALVQYDSSGNITKIGNSAQGNYGLAMCFNMVPQNQFSNCTYWLVSAPDRGISNYNHKTASPYGTGNHESSGMIAMNRDMLQLCPNGCTTNAYAVLLNYTFPSWLYYVTNGGAIYNGAGNYGATTSWERRDGWVSGSGGGTYGPNAMNSFNHSWPGMDLAEWLFRGMGGINPDDNNPGFQNTIIYPRPPLPGGPITNAWTSFNSIHGQIITSWSCTTNSSSTNLALTVSVPVNATASVYLPTTNLANITEGGIAATNAAGVLYYQATNGASVFEVGSGTYSFNATAIGF